MEMVAVADFHVVVIHLIDRLLKLSFAILLSVCWILPTTFMIQLWLLIYALWTTLGLTAVPARAGKILSCCPRLKKIEMDPKPMMRRDCRSRKCLLKRR